ncbi:1-acyl-sn-glycerol-3-phosphate acyltransferase [Candidatus Bipolaricaulota bacterium]|nr:1-acyl-sn-glycerol-3-phosphate acyltransferase [Candidatus Bipolaricaulota bacterium]
MSRFGGNLLDGVARAVTRILFRVDAQGLEKIPIEGPFILATNHVTAFEIPPLRMLLHSCGARTFVKAEAWDNKFMGWLLDQWESIPIKRGEFDMAALRTSLQVLKDGGMLGIMPEGTRSGDGKLGRGNAGITVIALKSGAPILPMAFWGVEKAKVNVKRFRRTDFHFRVGDPFNLERPTGKLTRQDRQRMADDVMRHLAELLPSEYRGVYQEPQET